MVATRSSTRKSSGIASETLATPTDTATTTSAAPPRNTNANVNGNGASPNGVHHHEEKRKRVAVPVDKTRWRLKADDGRHTWHFLDDDEAVKQWPQSYAEKWYLDLPLVRALPSPIYQAA